MYIIIMVPLGRKEEKMNTFIIISLSIVVGIPFAWIIIKILKFIGLTLYYWWTVYRHL